MGYVAQEGGLPQFLTVEQTLDLFCGLHSVKSLEPDKIDINTLYDETLKGLRSRYSEIMRCFIPNKKEHCCEAGDTLDDTAGDGSRNEKWDGNRDRNEDVCLPVDGLSINSSSSINRAFSYQTSIRTDNYHDNKHVLHCDNASSTPLSTPVPTPLPVPLSPPWGHLVGSSPTSILPAKYLSYPVHTLSGGNKKKLSVAISSINYPSFLAIDECTTGTAQHITASSRSYTVFLFIKYETFYHPIFFLYFFIEATFIFHPYNLSVTIRTIYPIVFSPFYLAFIIRT